MCQIGVNMFCTFSSLYLDRVIIYPVYVSHLQYVSSRSLTDILHVCLESLTLSLVWLLQRQTLLRTFPLKLHTGKRRLTFLEASKVWDSLLLNGYLEFFLTTLKKHPLFFNCILAALQTVSLATSLISRLY